MIRYPHRVAHVLCVLADGRWRTFHQIAESPVAMVYTALDAKQLTGTLVAMRNAGVVQSKRLHKPSGTEQLQWRLHPLITKMTREQ